MTADDIKDRLRQCDSLPELARVWAEVEPQVRNMKNPTRAHCVNIKDYMKIVIRGKETGYWG